MQQMVRAYQQCVIGIESEDARGDTSIGAAFHVGDGFFVTARHVVEHRRITDVVQPRYGTVGEIYSIRYPAHDRTDLALLSTDFNLDYSMSRVNDVGIQWPKADAIILGSHLDDWIGDEMLLMPVLLMGFPPVPTSTRPVLVAVSGEVNAVLDRYTTPNVHFVISAVPRGGFSGGPVIHSGGILLGVLTESLSRQTVSETEPGFAVVLSVEPIYHLLVDSRVAPRANRVNCYMFASTYDLSMFDDLLTPEERAAFEHVNLNPSEPEPENPGKPSPPIRGGAPLWVKSKDCWE